MNISMGMPGFIENKLRWGFWKEDVDTEFKVRTFEGVQRRAKKDNFMMMGYVSDQR